MRLYLAGPMTGIPQFNYPAFDEAAGHLRSCGHEVITPSELDDPETRTAALSSPDGLMGCGSINGYTWGDFLSRDVKIVADEADAVALLNGWYLSRGACLEAFTAILCGKPLFKVNPTDSSPYFPELTGMSVEEVMHSMQTSLGLGAMRGHSVRTLA